MQDDPERLPTPGEIIQAQLDERRWTHADLARIVGRHRPEISSVIRGSRKVSPELAVSLASALGEEPSYWLGLETARQLRNLPGEAPEVSRRLRLYTLAPVRDMIRRGWLPESNDPDELESALCDFFGVKDLKADPRLSVAPKKSDALSPLTPQQRAWVFRARKIAQSTSVAPFKRQKLDELAEKIRALAAYPEEARNVPTLLAEYGIRFVVVEPLPHGSIDGAAFWLSKNAPVMALSARLDRVDAVWFCICHEFAHIRNGDSASVDVDLADSLDSDKISAIERRANEDASALLIPPPEIESFIRRVGPLYSKTRIVQFAHKVQIHPGIVVGQLHHREEIGYSANREMLVKIRERLLSAAITDGWGRTVGTI